MINIYTKEVEVGGVKQIQTYAKIDELHVWERNEDLRAIGPEGYKRVVEQIRELKMYKPLITTPDGVVLGGASRLRALKELGHTDVWVSVIDAPTDSDKFRYNLSDNDSPGIYNPDGIANMLPQLEINLDNYGVTLEESIVLSDLVPEETPEEDEAPAVDNENPANSEVGMVYQLGRHRLMCGDSTNLDHVTKLMNGLKSDMVFTDPPYLMGFEGNVHADGSKSHNAVHGAILNDKMSKEQGEQFLFDIFTAIREFNKGAYYVCFYHLGLNYIFNALEKHGNDYKALIIWDKGNHTLSNSDYMSRYEPIIYGWFHDHKFYGGRSKFDIWHIDRTQKNDLHPTMKPVALCATAINNSSVPDDIVLDLFGGSGSTLIACEQTNRTAHVMELDPKYCDVIRKRYIKTTTGKEDGWIGLTPPIS